MGCGTNRVFDALYMELGAPAPMPITSPRAESPIEILKARLAQGEITVEQYEQMRGVLAGTSAKKMKSHIRKP